MIWYERLHHPPFNPTGYNCHEHLMFWFSLFHSLSYSSFLCNFPREASPIPVADHPNFARRGALPMPLTSCQRPHGLTFWVKDCDIPNTKKGVTRAGYILGLSGPKIYTSFYLNYQFQPNWCRKRLWDGYWIYLIDWMEHHLSISPIHPSRM